MSGSSGPSTPPPAPAPAPAASPGQSALATSALTTTFVGLSVVQVYQVVDWLSSWPLAAPSADVKMTFTVAALAVAHKLAKLAAARWPILASVDGS